MPNLHVIFMITFILFGTIRKHLSKWVCSKIKTNGRKMFIFYKPYKTA
jgi:hypothetical protein